MFGFGKVTDPVCGMKIEKKTAVQGHGQYFCSQACADKYCTAARKQKKEQQSKPHSCCH